MEELGRHPGLTLWESYRDMLLRVNTGTTSRPMWPDSPERTPLDCKFGDFLASRGPADHQRLEIPPGQGWNRRYGFRPPDLGFLAPRRYLPLWLRLSLKLKANQSTINSGVKSSMFGGVALFALIFYASGIPTLQKDILQV